MLIKKYYSSGNKKRKRQHVKESFFKLLICRTFLAEFGPGRALTKLQAFMLTRF